MAVATLAAVGTASAQSPFPSKPVRIFVPYAAGGGVDILARTLGEVVSKQWGQSVVIENRPGAGGVIASQALIASPPDGYTLIVVASGHATNPLLYPKIPYDTFKDFTPISLLGSSPNILLVRADSPFKTLGDMIAEARAKPGSLSFAHAGTGTSTHLAGELLKNLAKVDLNAVPYKGGAPAINDLLGGQIAMSFNNGPESLPQLEAGTLRALAVTTAAAGAIVAQCAWHGRDRAGLRHRGLVGPARAGRHARRCRDKTLAGFRRGPEHRAGEGAAGQARRRADRQLAQRIRRQDSSRLREVGSDHQGLRHEGGMTVTIPACLPPRDVSRPKVPPPPGACDTHAHVFGPAARFAYADDRSYTPPDAPLEKYLGMLDAIGFARGVLVQGSAHGRDNSAMLDALARRPDRLRGVAVADADIAPDELREWNRLGVRGCASIISFATGNCIIAAACRSR